MRLIDADKLTPLAYKSGDWGHPMVVDLVDIENEPTIDAVEVVRCKDCKLRPTCKHTRALGINGYCSDGEKA